jgi:hypothetical protein
MNPVAARRRQGRVVLRQEPPLWRVANLVCYLALLLPAAGLSIAGGRWAYVLVVTPGQTRSLSSYVLGPGVTVDMQLHLFRAATFFFALVAPRGAVGGLRLVRDWPGIERARNAWRKVARDRSHLVDQ